MLVTSISIAVQGNLHLTFLVVVLWLFSVHFRFHLYAWLDVDTKLGHIILILSQPVCCYHLLSREAGDTNFIISGLTQLGLESMVTRGENANHYTTDAVDTKTIQGIYM